MTQGSRILVRLAAVAVAIIIVFSLRRKPAAPAPAADTTAAQPVAAMDATPHTRIFATVGDSASRIEGLAEHQGKLYTADWKDGSIYSIDAADGRVARVGQLPTKPGEALLGVAADSAGNIYVGAPQTGLIYRIDADRLGKEDFKPRKDAHVFASGAAGANGLTFDANGHLWISGGEANAVYHVAPNGGKAEVFAKGFATISTDTTMPVRIYVTNGLGIDSAGNVYTANTGTGEITRLEVQPGYKAGAITSVVTDARLLGADGLIVDRDGSIWVTANFSNTLARVTPQGQVDIVVHDSIASVLHFPAEFKRVGRTFYLVNLNFPLGPNKNTSVKGAQVAAVEFPATP